MQLSVNGKNQAVDETCTVADLLRQCGLDESPCAVEVNEQLVPRSRHAEHELAEGDRVEIATLVGGG